MSFKKNIALIFGIFLAGTVYVAASDCPCEGNTLPFQYACHNEEGIPDSCSPCEDSCKETGIDPRPGYDCCGNDPWLLSGNDCCDREMNTLVSGGRVRSCNVSAPSEQPFVNQTGPHTLTKLERRNIVGYLSCALRDMYGSYVMDTYTTEVTRSYSVSRSFSELGASPVRWICGEGFPAKVYGDGGSHTIGGSAGVGPYAVSIPYSYTFATVGTTVGPFPNGDRNKAVSAYIYSVKESVTKINLKGWTRIEDNSCDGTTSVGRKYFDDNFTSNSWLNKTLGTLGRSCVDPCCP